MPTLNALFAVEGRDITQVAKRPSGIYVSVAHLTADDAVKEAVKDQPITIDDLMADDWFFSDAP